MQQMSVIASFQKCPRPIDRLGSGTASWVGPSRIGSRVWVSACFQKKCSSRGSVRVRTPSRESNRVETPPRGSGRVRIRVSDTFHMLSCAVVRAVVRSGFRDTHSSRVLCPSLVTLCSHKSGRCTVELYHASHLWYPPFYTSPMAPSALQH